LLKGKDSAAALAIIDTFQAMLQSKGSDSGDESVLEDGVAFAGVAKFPARVKCALLGWMATKDAISQSLELTSNVKKEQR
jgi:nitrogen fixation NifU-like protein